MEPSINGRELAEIEEPESLSAKYRHFASKDGTCFFCTNKVTNIHYKPTIMELKIHGAAYFDGQDLIALHVCSKCLGRCYRYRAHSLEELIHYVNKLEERGSVKGRVKNSVAMTPIGELNSKYVFMLDGQPLELIEVIPLESSNVKLLNFSYK